MNLLESFHERFHLRRRTLRLASVLDAVLPEGCVCLDVGCGSGQVAAAIMRQRADLRIEGVDVLVRGAAEIPVKHFDGCVLPYDDKSFDVAMFVDVLHHVDDPLRLLKEARRVARHWIVVKDHTVGSALSAPTLRLMDTVGNARFGVRLPFNFWTSEQWQDAWQQIDATIDYITSRLDIYPWPLSLVFDRDLHFVARLQLQEEGGCRQGQKIKTVLPKV
ncbi:MAG: class I SAM-dependent methyltransferase [Candidatus Hydrogenedentes bacterium]|nr:class I SAM-dependent methyltransferase [Candidatus Hydrogenedentota bacterium]